VLKVSLLFITLALMLSGCSQQQQPPIKILTSSWIGYSPLIYANEKGWLKEHNFEISTLVSLGESMMTFRMGEFNGLTTTQYEYQKLNSQGYNLVPVILLDRSNGGDMVMSNQSIDQLSKSTSPIDVYLESNSVNALVFNDFKKAHNLSDKTFHFFNKNQLGIITKIKQQALVNPTIVISHVPYNYELTQIGFKEVESTRDNPNLLILDALFVTPDTLKTRHSDLQKLKQLVDRALQNLEQDPQEYYKVVKPYIESPSYKEFEQSVRDIKWLNSSIPKELILKINKMPFETRNLL